MESSTTSSRFKVGDYVKIVRVTETHFNQGIVNEWESMIGVVSIVLEVYTNKVKLDIPSNYIWKFDEIELDKHITIKRILDRV